MSNNSKNNSNSNCNGVVEVKSYKRGDSDVSAYTRSCPVHGNGNKTGNIAEDLLLKMVDKKSADAIGGAYSELFNLKEAYSFYKVASVEPSKDKEDYISKNGKMLDSTNQIHDYGIKTHLQYRIRHELDKSDAPVFMLNSDSSIAKRIEDAPEIRDFIKLNEKSLKNGKIIINGKVDFCHDPDLYNTLHGVDIYEAKINSRGDLVLVIIDIYNFNKGRTSLRARVGEKFQNAGQLYNFGVYIPVVIPKEKLKKIFL